MSFETDATTREGPILIVDAGCECAMMEVGGGGEVVVGGQAGWWCRTSGTRILCGKDPAR